MLSHPKTSQNMCFFLLALHAPNPTPPCEWCEFGKVFNGELAHLYKLGDWKTAESWQYGPFVKTGYCQTARTVDSEDITRTLQKFYKYTCTIQQKKPTDTTKNMNEEKIINFANLVCVSLFLIIF